MSHFQFARTVFLCLLAGLAALGCNRTSLSGGKAGPQTQQDDPLEMARTALREEADREVVRSSLSQISLYLTQHADRKPTPLPAEQEKGLRELFHLTDDELAEVKSPSF